MSPAVSDTAAAKGIGEHLQILGTRVPCAVAAASAAALGIAFACALAGPAVPALAVETAPEQPTAPAEQPQATPKADASPYSTAKLAGTWKRSDGKKVSYRYRDGSYPTRIAKIGSKVYCFGAKGRLSTSRKALRVIDVEGNKHGVASDGSLVKGWRVSGSDLYYFSGTYLKGKASGKRGDVRFASSGKAVRDLNAAVKVQCMRVLSKVAKPGASKAAKLRGSWKYLTSKSRWSYSIGYRSFSFLETRTWAKRYAYEMFASKRGDCYGFAACLAALAHEVGYKDVQVVTCRVPGSRDGASDGYTRHGLTKVNGRWYDPEAQFAGWASGIYGARHYPMGMKSAKAHQYTWYRGTGKPKGITSSFNAGTKLSISRKGGYLYGRDGLRVLTGLWCYRGRLYRFDAKGRMKVSSYKKVQKAVEKGRPWSKLEKLIGAPSKREESASCYGEGIDVRNVYDEVIVLTFRPADGGREQVLSAYER